MLLQTHEASSKGGLSDVGNWWSARPKEDLELVIEKRAYVVSQWCASPYYKDML